MQALKFMAFWLMMTLLAASLAAAAWFIWPVTLTLSIAIPLAVASSIFSAIGSFFMFLKPQPSFSQGGNKGGYQPISTDLPEFPVVKTPKQTPDQLFTELLKRIEEDPFTLEVLHNPVILPTGINIDAGCLNEANPDGHIFNPKYLNSKDQGAAYPFEYYCPMNAEVEFNKSDTRPNTFLRDLVQLVTQANGKRVKLPLEKIKAHLYDSNANQYITNPVNLKNGKTVHVSDAVWHSKKLPSGGKFDGAYFDYTSKAIIDTVVEYSSSLKTTAKKSNHEMLNVSELAPNFFHEKNSTAAQKNSSYEHLPPSQKIH